MPNKSLLIIMGLHSQKRTGYLDKEHILISTQKFHENEKESSKRLRIITHALKKLKMFKVEMLE